MYLEIAVIVGIIAFVYLWIYSVNDNGWGDTLLFGWIIVLLGAVFVGLCWPLLLLGLANQN